MSQLRSDIWCSAFVRSHNDLGHFCVVAKKGHEIAGQIWIELDHLDNSFCLYSPAPALKYDIEKYKYERVFEHRLKFVSAKEIKKQIEQEQNFDPDIWIIALEMRKGELGLKVV